MENEKLILGVGIPTPNSEECFARSGVILKKSE